MIFPLYGMWVWNRCHFSGTAYEAQVYTGPVNCFVNCYAANKIKQQQKLNKKIPLCTFTSHYQWLSWAEQRKTILGFFIKFFNEYLNEHLIVFPQPFMAGGHNPGSGRVSSS